ncbi:phage tail protein [Clostridium botulinum]|uniref:phage tail protein n=1 Tax=Clostridium botulinum TaxID=1491 RepID=UPI0009B1BF77|nr:phage tail protein [Clostridium botulinum]NFL82068.1 phage tail protein [Clostridium botulinum]NFN12657.1 phage tail protein [Clostridium botulinum]NFO38213.1 phage tail protein [Clostridium botulinum]NFO44224.1 phage tail protein [Clostridium botulinum]NFT86752.1 phage tail protein [Clostridium botulinum]
MAEKFYSILTNIGKAKVANSIGLGTKVNFSKMKVGDGGGSYYEPTEGQTDLKNVVWEGNINHVTVDEKNPNWIHIEVMIPSTIGGFTIREYGAFDDENNLIGICKCAETYKPVIADGSTKELLLDLILCVVNTDTVELKIDPTIIFAKKGEVEQLRTDITAQLKDIANKVDNIKIADATTAQKGIVQLNNTTNSTSITQAATAKAVKLAMDRANSAFQSASDGKNAIAGKVGNVTGNNTHAEIANRIQTDKNTAASNLNSKGVSASGNEALASLVAKIANISIQGMGGKEFVIGNTRGLSLENKTKFNVVWGGFGVGYENEEYYANVQLGFNPSIFIAYGRAVDGDDYDKATCSTVINNICFFSTATGNSTGGYGNLYQPKYLNGVFTFPTRPNRNLTYIAFK